METKPEFLEHIAQKYSGVKASEVFGGLNLTTPQKDSGSRSHMFTSHLEQWIMLKNPETPKVFSGFELPYGKYTDSYIKTDDPLLVIDVIYKIPQSPYMKYVYVVQNLRTNIYDIILVSHYEKFSENHGYIKPFTQNDMFQPGTIIPDNTYIVKSNNHDEYGNYRYGLNANVCWISIAETEEDGVVISESFAKRAAYQEVYQTEILLNLNDVLLNLYPSNVDEYKSFPNIGEEIRNGILCAKRKFDYKNISSELTNNALCSIRMNDDLFKSNGKVIDVDIYINDKNELSAPHRSQLLYYYNATKNYYERIKNTLERIIHNKNNKYTFRLANLYHEAKDYINDDIMFSYNGSVFEFALLKITSTRDCELTKGNKITDRHGGKGVIVKILPDEYMPIDEFGNRAEIILSPPGVISRANIGQSYEHELNFISSYVQRMIINAPTIEKKYELLSRFLTDVNPKEGAQFISYWSTLTPEQQFMVLREVETDGIYIHQGSFFDNISYEGLKELYKKWKVKPGKIRIKKVFNKNYTQRFLARNQKNSVQDFLLKPDEHIEFTAVPTFDDNEVDDGYIFPKGQFVPNFMKEQDSDPSIVYELEQDSISVDRTIALKDTVSYIDEKTGLLVREFVSQQPIIIAQKYMLVLKHTPEAKFSVRSLGTINSIGIPNKVSRTSSGEAYSSTPIRFGYMEIENSCIRVSPEIVHRLIATMSTNPELRLQLAKILIEKDPFTLHDLPLSNEDIKNDIPSKELQVFLFCMGLEIDFNDY